MSIEIKQIIEMLSQVKEPSSPEMAFALGSNKLPMNYKELKTYFKLRKNGNK